MHPKWRPMRAMCLSAPANTVTHYDASPTRLYHLFGRLAWELGQYDNPERVKRGE
jgi:hypothetical protein